jgi:hypothetical protein
MLIHQWHVFTNLSPSNSSHERLGYFSFYQNRWCLVNTGCDTMCVLGGQEVQKGKAVVLRPGLRVLLSKEPHGRLLLFDFMSP